MLLHVMTCSQQRTSSEFDILLGVKKIYLYIWTLFTKPFIALGGVCNAGSRDHQTSCDPLETTSSSEELDVDTAEEEKIKVIRV